MNPTTNNFIESQPYRFLTSLPVHSLPFILVMIVTLWGVMLWLVALFEPARLGELMMLILLPFASWILAAMVEQVLEHML